MRFLNYWIQKIIKNLSLNTPQFIFLASMKVKESWYKPFTIFAFIWALIILALLWLPPSEIGASDALLFPGVDKLIHAFLFATLYILSAKAHGEQNFNTSKRVLLTYVIIYAVFTELIQLCLSERSFEIFDIIANIMGASIAYLFFNLTQN